MDATGTVRANTSATADTNPAPELDAVRRRRVELRESLNQLEQALAVAATARSEEWGERVHEALRQLEQDFQDHIHVTEGPDGLHQNVMSGAVRLANAVHTLSVEHVDISAQLANALQETQPPVSASDVVVVRERATQLLGRIVRHRQKGAELIYEAYATDIGGDG